MKPYHQEPGIEIYCADSREFIAGLGDRRFDLTLTDPPYGLGIAANPVRQMHRRESWDDAPPTADAIKKVVDSSEHAIIWGGNYFMLPPTKCFMVWDKLQPPGLTLAMCEQAWTNFDFPAQIYRKSVLSYRKLHPTQKPDDLMNWCLAFAQKMLNRNHDGDAKKLSVFDPFGGSGTTARAAKALGWDVVMVEREERHCETAANSLRQEFLIR